MTENPNSFAARLKTKKAFRKARGRPPNPASVYTHVAFKHSDIERLSKVATAIQADTGISCSPRETILHLLHRWEQTRA